MKKKKKTLRKESRTIATNDLSEAFFQDLVSKLRGAEQTEPAAGGTKGKAPLPRMTQSFLNEFLESLQAFVRDLQEHQANVSNPVQKVTLMGLASEITKLNNLARPIVQALQSGDISSVLSAVRDKGGANIP